MAQNGQKTILQVTHEPTLGTSEPPMPLTHSATAAMPAFPGRQYRAPSWEDCLSFQHSECSAHAGGRRQGRATRSSRALSRARAALLQKCRGLDHGLPGHRHSRQHLHARGGAAGSLTAPSGADDEHLRKDGARVRRVRLQFCLRAQRTHARHAKPTCTRLADVAAGAAPGPEPAGSSCPRSTSAC
jgi:hypothetical protein